MAIFDEPEQEAIRQFQQQFQNQLRQQAFQNHPVGAMSAGALGSADRSIIAGVVVDRYPAAVREDEKEWLRRRVREVMWHPPR